MAVTAGELQVADSAEHLDTTLVDTGTKHSPVHREGVFIGDPEVGSNRAQVAHHTPTGAALGVHLSDGMQFDAFNRLRVSSANTLFDAQQEYGLRTLSTWDATANGTYAAANTDGSVSDGTSAVGPRDDDTRLTPITAGSTDGNYAILQSRQYIRYIPGKSQLITISGIFASSVDDAVSFVNRSATSGAVVDQVFDQADWNFDKFDGTGWSGIALDFTKMQILVIDAQWLGSGRVRFGFNVDGIIYMAHEDKHANNVSVPYTQTFNLPVRLEGRTDSTGTTYNSGYFDLNNGVFIRARSTTQGGTIYMNCVAVHSESGGEEKGFPRHQSTGTTGRALVAGPAWTPVISIRPKTTFQGQVNRAHVEEITYDVMLQGTTNAELAVFFGATLNVSSWQSADANSTTEYDTSAGSMSGGTALRGRYVVAGGTGQGGNATEGQVNIRTPLILSQIDTLTARQLPVTIAMRSISGSPTAFVGLDWFEQN